MRLGIPDLHPDPLVKGTDPRIRNSIRIRTKMSRINNAPQNLTKTKDNSVIQAWLHNEDQRKKISNRALVLKQIG
jgi:hypothetical protein